MSASIDRVLRMLRELELNGVKKLRRRGGSTDMNVWQTVIITVKRAGSCTEKRDLQYSSIRFVERIAQVLCGVRNEFYSFSWKTSSKGKQCLCQRIDPWSYWRLKGNKSGATHGARHTAGGRIRTWTRSAGPQRGNRPDQRGRMEATCPWVQERMQSEILKWWKMAATSGCKGRPTDRDIREMTYAGNRSQHQSLRLSSSGDWREGEMWDTFLR